MHNLNRSKKEFEAYKYDDLTKMFNEIKPPLSVLIMQDQHGRLNVCSGNQDNYNASFKPNHTKTDLEEKRKILMQSYLKVTTQTKKVKIGKDECSIQFNADELDD